MTFNNLQSENAGAFLTSSEKLERLGTSSPYTPTTTIRQPTASDKNKCNKIVNDCCYSLSNLALIVFSILALIFSIKFLHDDPLYEFGEHLLSVRFYRQIIYIIAIMPLILLVPIFNALIGFFFADNRKHEPGNTLLKVKLIYMIIMAMLAFVGLVFVAPSIRTSSVAYQLEYELRGHMKRRYENEFSYVFLDRIQDEYNCCDELWYRANYFDKIPISCYFNDDPTFSQVYERTCDVVIGSMVSTRCSIIAFSLVIIIISLVSLISIDICELLRDKSQQYNIEQHESKLMMNKLNDRRGEEEGEGEDDENDCDDDNHPLPPRSSSFRVISNKSKPLTSRDQLVSEIDNRLRQEERIQDTPLLHHQSRTTISTSPKLLNSSPSFMTPSVGLDSSQDSQEDNDSDKEEENGVRLTPILTRANYVPGFRSQSPMFQSTSPIDQYSILNKQLPLPPPHLRGKSSPTKSVLKKTSSFQRLPDDELDEYDRQQQNYQDDQQQQQQQQQLHRDIQTRRSLLNVRFAE